MSDKPGRLRDLVGPYLAEQCTVILDAPAQLRAGENVVHTTRVAVRRLRSTLRVFRDLFDVPKAAYLEEELVWWAGMLGEVRDLDILAARLGAQLAALPAELVLGPVPATIEIELAARRSSAVGQILTTLDGDRYRRLDALIHSWRADPPFTPAADRPAKKIKSYLRSADKKVRRRLKRAAAAHDKGEESASLFHSARKAGKRHRYAVEAAVPLLGSAAEKIVAQRKDLQDLLGEHQDQVVSAAFLREFGALVGSRDGHNGFTYGLLHERETAAGADVLDRLSSYV